MEQKIIIKIQKFCGARKKKKSMQKTSEKIQNQRR